MADQTTLQQTPAPTGAGTDTLTITDNRTGQQYTLPIAQGAIRANDLLQIKAGPEDKGLTTYDPGFLNTAACKSAITYIDGDEGILEYRGYPIEQLAERSTFLEVAYLLLNGVLPTAEQEAAWEHEITHHTLVTDRAKAFLSGFHYDAHPMGMLISSVAALSTIYPEAKAIHDPEIRRQQIVRLMAKMPTLAAMTYRHMRGLHYVLPNNDLPYVANFLAMMFRMTEAPYVPDPVLVRALDVLFILHADHEQNCSTNAVRGVASSGVDPYCALAAGIAALYGPLHGGANEAVLRMLAEIGTADRIPEFIG
ncbi:MAG TPA: citrate/2-methylcitrate synthase, partial [bacterium]|nr:citrate/2-methylcitrate synthase [bacterium]